LSAVASRKGGQVWAAYKVGYPTANKIRLWRVGTKQKLTISAKDARHVMLTPDLNGRLWLAWYSGASGTIKVTRTNTAVSRIGAVRNLKPPSKRGSYNSVYATAGTGLGGWLHLLVNSAIGTAVFRVSRAVKSGKYLVTGFKRGFAKGSDTVRVT
jgi:hypothetical protein